MMAERSDAYIAEEDMEADFGRPADLEELSPEAREVLAESNAEKLKDASRNIAFTTDAWSACLACRMP